MPRLPHPLSPKAFVHLSKADPHLLQAWQYAGKPPKRDSDPGFGSLCRTLIAQQISAGAARTIWKRFEDAIGLLSPESVLAQSEESLRGVGLSRPKIRYIKALAEATLGGQIRFDAHDQMTDEEIIAELIKTPGIGRWTAEIYLLFSLQRPDVWPIDDLALQIALQRLKGLRQRPDRKHMLRLAEPWRPWRGTAALVLWRYYSHKPQAVG